MADVVLQRITVEVRGDAGQWLDTGLVVPLGQYLHVIASGQIEGDGKTSFPEGWYSGGIPEDAPQPDQTFSAWSVGSHRPAILPCNNVKPWALALKVVQDGDPSPALANNVGLSPNREATFSGVEGRVWAIFNDNVSYARSYSGVFYLTLERIGERPIEPGSGEFPYGVPSPIHFVPASILKIKQRAEQCFADLLALKPVNGPWEGWTSWDRKLIAPQYEDNLGNITPSLTYNPNVASRSAQPVALKLDVRSADVTVFAPKMYDPPNETPVIFMDRAKIDSGYYDGAYWEYAQVDPDSLMTDRFLIHCGFIGNIQLDDLIATVELSGYEMMANRDTGDEYHFICQVGTRLKEEFGLMRCWNEVLHDGPHRPDWSTEGTVLSGGYDTVRIGYSATAVSGIALNDAVFKTRLSNGDIYFKDAPLGGTNAGTRMVLRSGLAVAPLEVTVALRLSLFSQAKPGDKVILVAGCNRKKTDCIAWNNLPNMRAQDLESNADLNKRYRTGA